MIDHNGITLVLGENRWKILQQIAESTGSWISPESALRMIFDCGLKKWCLENGFALIQTDSSISVERILP